MISQYPFERFPARVFRKLGQSNVDCDRDLVRRQHPLEMYPQFTFGCLKSWLELDDGADLLAENPVRQPDDRGIQYRAVREECGFDLHAINVLAPSNEHVLDSIEQVDESLIVLPTDIARAIPAIDKGGACRLRVVPVSLHHIGAADPDLAYFATRRLRSIVPDDTHIADWDGRAYTCGLSLIIFAAICGAD